MPLFLYNSLTKKEESFKSIEKGKVRMYTCGPTVYSRPHVGNYSSFLLADLLRRWLEAGHGYEVTHVKNITDVGHLLHDADHGDDKVQKEAEKEKLHPLEIARRYEEQYLEDERALNMLEPYARPRATETISEMIALIEILVERDHAYETEDGVYFSVETFSSYGKLSGNKLQNLKKGARVSVDEQKRHPADFALWKKCIGENANHILRWDSVWGEGFPGWHIECSAMGTKFLGDHFDIHTGGEDLIFPHHECEIAQSEGAGDGKPHVRYWVHRRFIDLGEERMSKSTGNILSLPDVVAQGYSPLDVRYYLLSVHYRTNLKFTERGLEDAHKARRKIVEWMKEVKEESPSPLGGEGRGEGFKKQFIIAMDHDLNTPEALAVVFDAMASSRKGGNEKSYEPMVDLIRHTFGCFDPEEEVEIPPKVQNLLEERENARKQKNFAESDALREQIRVEGYEVRDGENEQQIKKI